MPAAMSGSVMPSVPSPIECASPLLKAIWDRDRFRAGHEHKGGVTDDRHASRDVVTDSTGRRQWIRALGGATLEVERPKRGLTNDGRSAAATRGVLADPECVRPVICKHAEDVRQAGR